MLGVLSVLRASSLQHRLATLPRLTLHDTLSCMTGRGLSAALHVQVFLSDDGASWARVQSGTFPDTDTLKTFNLNTATAARGIRIVATTEAGMLAVTRCLRCNKFVDLLCAAPAPV